MTKKVNISTENKASLQSINNAIAQKIKKYRKQKKLSLDALSQQAGISKGMLVEIENCTANPSIAILCKLSAALGISVADIVDIASKPDNYLIDSEDIPTLWTSPKGGAAQLLAGTSGPKMIELWRWEMPPGDQLDSPAHSPGTTELLFVEKGTLTIQIDGTQLVVNAGCSAVTRTDVPHSYSNQSHSQLVFMMTVAELVS